MWAGRAHSRRGVELKHLLPKGTTDLELTLLSCVLYDEKASRQLGLYLSWDSALVFTGCQDRKCDDSAAEARMVIVISPSILQAVHKSLLHLEIEGRASGVGAFFKVIK